MLIDEIDTFMEGKSEMAGILNLGYSRGGFVMRTENNGKDFITRTYRVYGPKAMAGIALERSLPDPTLSRGIEVALKRKTKDAKVKRLRAVNREKLKEIFSKIKSFVDTHRSQLSEGWEELPEELTDREQDNWEGMLAIANCLGVQWYEKACAAALKIADETSPPKSPANQILEDVREVLETATDSKISSANLLELLLRKEDSPWKTYNRGQPMVQHQLTKLLRSYGIKSKTVRMGYSTPKGFETREFQDAFDRYLPPRAVAEEEPPPVENDSPTVSPLESAVKTHIAFD